MGDHFAFLLPAIMVIFGGAFLIVWRWGARPAGAWGAAYLLGAAAFSTASLLPGLPDTAHAIAADVLFALSFFCYGEALLTQFGRPKRRALRGGVATLSVVVSGWGVLADRLPVELVASDVGCAALLAIPLGAMIGRLRRPVDRALAFITALVIADCLLRAATVSLTVGNERADSFMETPYAFLMQANATVLGMIFALVALAAVTLDVVALYRTEADTDSMTGLLNRRGFEHGTARRRDSGRGLALPACVLTCDIDHFKRVNDLFGHAAGDRVIVTFAACLRAALPEGSVLARFGGEEFVGYLPGLAPAEAERVADRARRTFAAQGSKAANVHLALTASFGVAAVEAGDFSLHDAIGRADRSLYEAKNQGRNRVSVRHAAVVAVA